VVVVVVVIVSDGGGGEWRVVATAAAVMVVVLATYGVALVCVQLTEIRASKTPSQCHADCLREEHAFRTVASPLRLQGTCRFLQVGVEATGLPVLQRIDSVLRLL
jgi:hypothetical protein